jgi:hypothetical protein
LINRPTIRRNPPWFMSFKLSVSAADYLKKRQRDIR